MTLFPQNKALPNGYARRGWSGGYGECGKRLKNQPPATILYRFLCRVPISEMPLNSITKC
jgi:hypothetical protein